MHLKVGGNTFFFFQKPPNWTLTLGVRTKIKAHQIIIYILIILIDTLKSNVNHHKKNLTKKIRYLNYVKKEKKKTVRTRQIYPPYEAVGCNPRQPPYYLIY